MNSNNLTIKEQSIVEVLRQEPLTSFQLLKKVDDISMILSLYNVMDELKNKGVIKSFVEQDVKYHCVA